MPLQSASCGVDQFLNLRTVLPDQDIGLRGFCARGLHPRAPSNGADDKTTYRKRYGLVSGESSSSAIAFALAAITPANPRPLWVADSTAELTAFRRIACRRFNGAASL